MKNQKKIFFSVMGLLLIIVLAMIFLGKKDEETSIPNGKYDEFAKCLASKDITMYGAVWCTHCKTEKARFGTSFKYVPYVECTENPKECLAKGIEAYPTWIDGNGKKYVGEQGLDKLSEISSCQLPIN